ncbi:MAG: hypothetical protein GY790_08205 [Bacteroidetes bacterium]|nr:hypothetical protein [Bacteroidota bacterium]
MKGLKHISVLLLVNIFILIGHSLVPHYHHVASPTHPSSHECPEGTHEHHDEDAGNKHCHAFNNMHFVQYNQSAVPAPMGLSSIVLISDPGPEQEPCGSITAALQLFLKPPILSPELTGILSLRGPPARS